MAELFSYVDTLVRVLSVPEGGNSPPFFSGYRCLMKYGGDPIDAFHDVEVLITNGAANPGCTCECRVIFFHPEYCQQMKTGTRVRFFDGISPRADGIVIRHG